MKGARDYTVLIFQLIFATKTNRKYEAVRRRRAKTTNWTKWLNWYLNIKLKAKSESTTGNSARVEWFSLAAMFWPVCRYIVGVDWVVKHIGSWANPLIRVKVLVYMKTSMPLAKTPTMNEKFCMKTSIWFYYILKWCSFSIFLDSYLIVSIKS